MTDTNRGARSLTRRGLLASAAAVPLVTIISRRGDAAEFSYKFATGQDPTHPVNVRAGEALARIRDASQGRLDMKLFPANQLGSDTDLLSQVRNGGVEFFNLATSILNTLVPAAGLLSIGFAFADDDAVWKSADGPLGRYLADQIAKDGARVGCAGVEQRFPPDHVVDPRHRRAGRSERLQASRAAGPDRDVAVPGARPPRPRPSTSTNSTPRCRPRVVEGQENPLPIIATTKLYEVQKSLSLTGHVWDGYQILGNRRAWAKLPQDLREIVTRELSASGQQERGRHRQAQRQPAAGSRSKGMTVHDRRSRQVPRCAQRNQLLPGLEGQVRR